MIGTNGTIKQRYERDNEHLMRCQAEMDADPDKLRELATSPDSFATAIPVYTYAGGAILEKQCETPGWPNVTHDGCLMYENTYSTDKAQVVAWAKRNSAAAIQLTAAHIQRLEKDLAAARAELAQHEAARAKLEADYPSEAGMAHE